MSDLNQLKYQQGMTLLEVLIAVALLSVIAVMAYASLFTLTSSNQHLAETVERINQENTALALFNQDIKMALASANPGLQKKQPDFVADSRSLLLQRLNPMQEVPRHGLINSVKNKPLAVLAVRWFVRDGVWYRATRSAAATQFAAWQERPMMVLSHMQCQYLNFNGRREEFWPPEQGPVSSLPKSVHCTLRFENNRQIRMHITPWQQIW
ncbi:type II secretion system protein J [Marinicella pacifica]|uniref:Type II secretion system protein J n=1 Tax=Marinicella pacifica TaxID=1171543 RepID=A0A917CEV3_9GAMM|nr:prepilin-type N-terminal cleavage/methylation domain-containing protein [Marinicella pacifica]GGF85608.1 type II secretion system protein J [Marinicella pacifica]